MKVLILLIMAFIASSVEARFAQPTWPDFTFAILFALFIYFDFTTALVIALIFGIMRDGLNPGLLWISPLAFSINAFIVQGLKKYLNIQVWPALLLYIWLTDVPYRIAIFTIYGVRFDWISIGVSVLFTGILGVLLIKWILR
ncbi:MAG: hypothetical protein DRQ10_01300 [Candidatus Hydrothermota bacterium]|nr:MAG: hypothetical protein DRQ10_01300 [Candidatus Hydrothermae bacterium]